MKSDIPRDPFPYPLGRVICIVPQHVCDKLVVHAAGMVGSTNSGLTFQSKLNTPLESATLSYDFMFDPGYDWTHGGKLPGLCSDGAAPYAMYPDIPPVSRSVLMLHSSDGAAPCVMYPEILPVCRTVLMPHSTGPHTAQSPTLPCNSQLSVRASLRSDSESDRKHQLCCNINYTHGGMHVHCAGR